MFIVSSAKNMLKRNPPSSHLGPCEAQHTLLNARRHELALGIPELLLKQTSPLGRPAARPPDQQPVIEPDAVVVKPDGVVERDHEADVRPVRAGRGGVHVLKAEEKP